MITLNRTREIAYKGYTYQFRYNDENAAFEDYGESEHQRIFNKYVHLLDSENTPMFEERNIMDVNGNSIGWVRKVRVNGF